MLDWSKWFLIWKIWRKSTCPNGLFPKNLEVLIFFNENDNKFLGAFLNTDMPGDSSGVSVRRNITSIDHYQPFQHYLRANIERPKSAKKVKWKNLNNFFLKKTTLGFISRREISASNCRLWTIFHSLGFYE